MNWKFLLMIQLNLMKNDFSLINAQKALMSKKRLWSANYTLNSILNDTHKYTINYTLSWSTH